MQDILNLARIVFPRTGNYNRAILYPKEARGVLKPGFEKQINFEDKKLKDEDICPTPSRIRAKVRFDYRGRAKPSRFFFGGKSTEEVAGEIRQQQAALWRNVPLQGVMVENIELGEIYTVYDEESDHEIAFAPMELDVVAETLDDLVLFAVRAEFRRLRISEPERLVIPRQDMERIFFQVHEQSKSQAFMKSRKYND
jgi:hypothetical protein